MHMTVLFFNMAISRSKARRLQRRATGVCTNFGIGHRVQSGGITMRRPAWVDECRERVSAVGIVMHLDQVLHSAGGDHEVGCGAQRFLGASNRKKHRWGRLWLSPKFVCGCSTLGIPNKLGHISQMVGLSFFTFTFKPLFWG